MQKYVTKLFLKLKESFARSQRLPKSPDLGVTALTNDSSTDSDIEWSAVMREPEERAAVPIAAASESSRAQSDFFCKLPPEIRQMIYVDVLDDSGLVLHLFRGRERSLLALRYGSVDAEWGRVAGRRVKFRHEPCAIKFVPQMDRVVHRTERGRNHHEPEQTPCAYLPLLLVCKQM